MHFHRRLDDRLRDLVDQHRRFLCVPRGLGGGASTPTRQSICYE
jgi:hypothetical protein